MRVLFADDDQHMRDFLALLLEAAGHEATATSDGAAAFAHWKRERPPLVLLDWQMPGMDGLEVCRAIRAAETTRETFVVVVTSRDGSDDLRSVLDAGADDYIAKPLTQQAFATRLAITERRIEADGARREAERLLAEARFLAGIGETTIAIQHEVNNPLAALLGTATLFEQGLVRPGEEREALATIVAQARRIADVMKRLAELRAPQSVEYAGTTKMIDLSGGSGSAAR